MRVKKSLGARGRLAAIHPPVWKDSARLRTAKRQRLRLTRVLAYSLSMRCVLGFDGGGAKTDCVLMEEGGAILARGRSGASNPHRIGFAAARVALELLGPANAGGH